MSRFSDLAKLFALYEIYPRESYTADTPLRIFQRMVSDYYSSEVNKLLSVQRYSAAKRGADLPWWGKGFFHKRKGFRTIIIAPDSKSPDAGSVVFFAHLFDHIKDSSEYQAFLEKLDDKWGFPHHNWRKLRQQFSDWGLDMEFVYITDAAKVYQENSTTEIDFERSKELLYAEIEVCKPDLLILLGAAPLAILRSDLKYRSTVESKEYIEINQYRAVVSPFPASNGLGQKNFQARLKNATHLIKTALGNSVSL